MLDGDEFARPLALLEMESQFFECDKDVWRSREKQFRVGRSPAVPPQVALVFGIFHKVIEQRGAGGSSRRNGSQAIGIRQAGLVDNQKTIQSVGERRSSGFPRRPQKSGSYPQ